MKHKLVLIISGFLLGLQTLTAQQSKTVTLKEAIDLTLAYSKTLKVNKTKIEEASQLLKKLMKENSRRQASAVLICTCPFNQMLI